MVTSFGWRRVKSAADGFASARKDDGADTGTSAVSSTGQTQSDKPGVTGQRAVMTPPKRRPFMSREMCGDIAAALTVMIITGAAFAATPLADRGVIIDGFATASDPWILICTGFLAGLALAEALRQGGYFHFDQLLHSWDSLRGVVWRWGLTLLSLIALSYAFGVSQLLSRSWLLAWALFATVGLVLGRFATTWVLRNLTRDGRSLCRKIAVVGDDEVAELFLKRAGERESGLLVVARYTAEEMAETGQGAMDQAQSLVEAGMLDDVILCLPDSKSEQITQIISRLSALPVHVALCPDHFWLERGVGQMTTIGTMPLLTVHRRPITGWNNFVKMLEDKILGSILFLFALPIMVICAIAVRLDSPGPIFFIQNRQGFAGEIFPIVKFRTMRVMENGDTVVQATKDDDRITRVGRFLRRASLDELPQLWNVLRGDMSLVGPRPHAIAHDKYYMHIIADYAARHKVKPGITGWAQVKGFRGETADDETMAARIRHDLAYIENWSLTFDLRIIVMTVLAVILPKNAY
ncbi:undecaprenyl-phosphate glucose phosphotransferase [Parvularcula sp. LCG005]|uniref:undecaprenyl-phosphate glucose phosphotransferase n=1 Tax=Parvularcula sp. LCG005 TaxID=3078805 RepID=UPI002941FBEF|nr:undecaprenyl-phosphate glucose phosphotransferase [Parvularcula sp. LCG005]WOI53666.1 undecaprenyl-phosphate glucose phosphotransferase [Parvularcula sp. LCG005]